jgi:molybdenum cofactor biosynthesis protein B
MPYTEHTKEAARHVESIDCAVITVSDTRTEQTDANGVLMKQLLADAGHRVVRYAIVRDEPEKIRAMLDELVRDAVCPVILINGGTGISTRDRTYEAVVGLLERRIEGFGELFRYLSYAEIGSGAMLSRAVAGICHGKLIFSMPGSTDAVRLAMNRLIVPELAHLVWELRKQ